MAVLREVVTSADGVEIGMVTEGVGPRLLLVHGGMGSVRRWQPIWPLLTDRYRVTAMDRRGRGLSGDGPDYALRREYHDVLAAAQHLAVPDGGRIDVFAHSIGAVCVLGAASRGAPFRRIVLYEPPGPETVPREWIDRITGWIAGGQVGRAVGSFLVEIIGLDQALVTALRETPMAAEAIQIAAVTMVREAQALAALDRAELVRAVTAPVLLLLGTASPPWAHAITRELAHGLPRATLTPLAGHGHEALDTDPALVATHLHRFLSTDGQCQDI